MTDMPEVVMDVKGLRERQPGDAPIWLDADEANAWADGYNAAAREAATALSTMARELAEARSERDVAIARAVKAELLAQREMVEHGKTMIAAGEEMAASASKDERIAALEKALEPFARIADDYADQEDDDFQVWRDFDVIGASLPLRIFRSARRARSTKEPA